MKHPLTLLTACFLQTIILAQNPTICDTIVLKDGKTILAKIDKSTNLEIFFETCGNVVQGQRVINKSLVKEIRTSQGVKTVSGETIVPTESDTTQLWLISTTDGNDYIGVIVSQDSNKVVIRTKALGEIGLPKSQIKVMEPVKQKQMVNGKFWYESPHSTRYFWAPNGFGLHKGEGYYQNTWIFLSQASYGLSNNFSIGAGLIPTFLFGGGGAIPFWITPKFSIPLQEDRLNLGAGVIYANALGVDSDGFGGAGITYGVLTAGSRDRNITFGLGYGFIDGDWAKRPLVTISGMYRTTRKFTFLTENYFIPMGDGDNFGVISVGGRYGGKGIAIDFGLFAPITPDLDFFFALPWLGINVPFGKHRSK